MFEAVLRRFKQMDDVLYANAGSGRWRHFVDPDFMGSIFADVFNACDNDVRSQFVGFHINYDVFDCSMVYFPFLMEHRWVCYAWAIRDQKVVVFDPSSTYVPLSQREMMHGHVVDVLKRALRKVVFMYCPQRNYQWESLSCEIFPFELERDLCVNRSGIMCAYFCLAFDGDIMRPPFQMDSFEGVAAMLFMEVLKLRDNEGFVPDSFRALV